MWLSRGRATFRAPPRPQISYLHHVEENLVAKRSFEEAHVAAVHCGASGSSQQWALLSWATAFCAACTPLTAVQLVIRQCGSRASQKALKRNLFKLQCP